MDPCILASQLSSWAIIMELKVEVSYNNHRFLGVSGNLKGEWVALSYVLGRLFGDGRNRNLDWEFRTAGFYWMGEKQGVLFLGLGSVLFLDTS